MPSRGHGDLFEGTVIPSGARNLFLEEEEASTLPSLVRRGEGVVDGTLDSVSTVPGAVDPAPGSVATAPWVVDRTPDSVSTTPCPLLG
jgi:hypothetical protein